MGKRKYSYYGVARGRQVGVYNSWAECEEQVKCFTSRAYCIQSLGFGPFSWPLVAYMLYVQHMLDMSVGPRQKSIQSGRGLRPSLGP